MSEARGTSGPASRENEGPSRQAKSRRTPPSLPTENLAIMFTDIAGFTEKTSRQSREENARMMAEHDALLLPLIRAFSGRKVNREAMTSPEKKLPDHYAQP